MKTKPYLKIHFALFCLLWLGLGFTATAQSPMGPVTQTNVVTADAGGFSSTSDIATNSSNRYAVVWTRKQVGGLNLQSVFLRIYNSDGTPATGEITVIGDEDINAPQVGMDQNGYVYVLYDDKVAFNGTNYYLKMKRYSPTGALLNSVTIEQIDQNCQYDLAVQPNGNVVCFYTNTANQLRLRMLSSSLTTLGTSVISSGTAFTSHYIDERSGVFAVAYSGGGQNYVRKYMYIMGNFYVLYSATLTQGFSYDPIALRADGKVGLLLSSGSSTTYNLRNSDLTSISSVSLPNSTYSLNAAIDSDINDQTYIVWNNTSGGTDGRVYNASNTLTGSFTHGFGNGSPFWHPTIATYDCRFVVSAREQISSDVYIKHRRFTCENCNFNTDFTYSVNCIGTDVEINVTASQSYPSSQFILYQVSTPSTSGPLGPIIDEFWANSGTFTVPNVPGTYYVIKHGNWSQDCPWQETRKLVTLPTFNYTLKPCFSFNVTGQSQSSFFDLSLTPCYYYGSSTHYWYVYQSNSSTGPWTYITGTTSSGNTSVVFNNLDKGYYYRVLHYMTSPCSAYYWSEQVFYVNPFGNVMEDSPATYKEGTSAENHVVINQSSTPELDLWPNPAKEQLSFSWEGVSAEESLHAEVYTAQGQRVLSQALTSGQNQAQLSVSELSDGLYILVMKSADRVVVRKKFTIQR